MKIKTALIATLCAFSCSALFANTVVVKEEIKLKDMDCKTFIDFDEDYQPKIVYWAAAHADNRDIQEVVVDVDTPEGIVPAVIAHCKKSPGSHFYATVKAKLKG